MNFNDLYQIFILVVGLSLPVGVLLMIVYGLYRKIRGRTWYESGTCYIGQIAFADFKAGEVSQSVQEIQYMDEDERDEAYSGDDFDPEEFMTRKED